MNTRWRVFQTQKKNAPPLSPREALCLFCHFSAKMIAVEIRSGPRFHHFSSKMFPFQRRSGPQFCHFSAKMIAFEIRSGPRFHHFSSKMLPFHRRSGPRFRHFSAEMLAFEIRSWPPFHHFSSSLRGTPCRVGSGRQFAFSYSFSTTRPRFARAMNAARLLNREMRREAPMKTESRK